MKRFAAAAATLVAIAALLTGCSSSNSGDGGKVQLTMWVLNETKTVNDGFKDLVARYEKANPDVTIKLSFRDGDAHKQALRTAVGTSAMPDIFRYWTGVGLGGQLIDAGASLDLTKYYKKYGWDDRFSAANLAQVTQFGGYNGVPFGSRAEAMFYNKKLFAQAGITAAPTTYDELVADADKLKAAGITPITFGGTVNWHLERLTDTLMETACGAKENDKLTSGKAKWTSDDCVVKGYEDLADWGSKYIQTGFSGVDYDTASSSFLNGKTAMTFEGDWYNATLADNKLNKDDYGLFQFPTGTGRLFGLSDAMYVNKQTKHADEAAKFLDFITSDAQQQKELGVFTPIPINKNVQPPADLAPLDKAWFTFFADSKGLYTNNDQNFSPAEATEWQRIQNLVVVGQLSPKDAPAQFQKYIDDNK
jgi:raffinose/stachyose/melibiose transport system substrate-binding protein